MIAMTRELRELSALLTSTSGETSRLSTEITQGTEHMAQAASGIADTAASLSEQARGMAGTIQHLTADATRLRDAARTVTEGAQEGIARNAQLRALAGENHERLDESARRLEDLARDVRDSAAATEPLARRTRRPRPAPPRRDERPHGDRARALVLHAGRARGRGRGGLDGGDRGVGERRERAGRGDHAASRLAHRRHAGVRERDARRRGGE